MKKKVTLENDYERMVPEFHKGTLTYAEHMTRYLAAQKLVAGKTVLDIASGSGYGTQIIAEKAKKVYGVDVEKAAVLYAQEYYPAENIEYLVGDGESIPLEDNSVDVVVTFETIEHIKDYRRFVKEIKRVLKPDGLALVSTPNDLEFAEGNHFHLHEFAYKELVDLLGKDFKNIKSYFQATWKYVAVADEATMKTEGVSKIPTLNLSVPKAEEYLYFYLLCSNRKITETVEAIGAVGEHYSDRQLMGERSSAIAQANRLESYLAKANQQALEMQKERDDLRQELREVTSSRAYKVTRKLANAKKKVRPSDKAK